jgi:hypothetical protein
LDKWLEKIASLLEYFFRFKGLKVQVFYYTERITLAPGASIDMLYDIPMGKEAFLKDIKVKQFSNIQNFSIDLYVDSENFPLVIPAAGSAPALIILDDDVLDLSRYVNTNNKARVSVKNNDLGNNLDIYYRIRGYNFK